MDEENHIRIFKEKKGLKMVQMLPVQRQWKKIKEMLQRYT
jgi:hypothetical protein